MKLFDRDNIIYIPKGYTCNLWTYIRTIGTILNQNECKQISKMHHIFFTRFIRKLTRILTNFKC